MSKITLIPSDRWKMPSEMQLRQALKAPMSWPQREAALKLHIADLIGLAERQAAIIEALDRRNARLYAMLLRRSWTRRFWTGLKRAIG